MAVPDRYGRGTHAVSDAWETSLIQCECGRGDVVAAMVHYLGGRIVLFPLHDRNADNLAADWRCSECIADAAEKLLHLSPSDAMARGEA